MVPDSSLTLDEALGVDLDEVRSHILGAPGVADVHDLHAWRSRRA